MAAEEELEDGELDDESEDVIVVPSSTQSLETTGIDTEQTWGKSVNCEGGGT